MTSPFGYRILNGTLDYHNGVDLVGTDDINVVWCLDGTVIASAFGKECGNQIEIFTKSGKTMFFCHLKSRAVKVGDKVKRGQIIGVMGSTGIMCFGAHLHFGLYEGKGRQGKLLNAQKFLNL